MIERYEIKIVDGKERLYLYLNVDYEFSLKEFNNKIKKLDSLIKEYIVENKIAFKGNVILNS